MWYVSSLIIIEIVIHLISKDMKRYNRNFIITSGIFAVLFFIPIIGKSIENPVVTRIATVYNGIFKGTNNFAFYGFWFMLGMLWYRTQRSLKKSHLILSIVTVAILRYVFSGIPIIGDIMVVGYNFLIFLFFYHLGNAIGFNTIRMRSMSSIIYFTHILVIMIVEMAFLMIKGQYKGYESPIFAITIILLIIYSYMMTANKRVFTQIKKVLY